MSPDAQNSKKFKLKIPKPLIYGLMVFGSFVVVLGSLFFYVSKIEFPRRMEEMEAYQAALADSLAVQDSLARIDSLAMADSLAKIDSLRALGLLPPEFAFVDTTSGQELTEADFISKEKLLIHQMAMLKDQLNQKQKEVKEMATMVRATDDIVKQLDDLEKKYEEKQKELEYFQETLPESVARKIKEQQEASQIAAQTQAQQVTVQNSNTPTQAELDAEQEANVRKLAKIYEAMRPEQAAPILEKMDNPSVIELLLKMRQRNAARILTQFPADRAAQISLQIGGGK